MSDAAPPVSAEALLGHSGFVRGLARSLLADEHRAEDLVQETWVAALSRPPRGVRSLRAWLGAVVRNLAVKSWRGEGRRVRRETAVARPVSVPDGIAIAEREAERRRVVRAVLGLEEPYRTAVVLRYYEELPPREIARRTMAPVETVRTRLRRALVRLEESLVREHEGDRRALGLSLLPLSVARRPTRSLAPVVVGAGVLALLAAGLVVRGARSVVPGPPRDAPSAGSRALPTASARAKASGAAGTSSAGRRPAATGGSREAGAPGDPRPAAGAPAATGSGTECGLEGTVTGPDGFPLAGAVVELRPTREGADDRTEHEGGTDARGRFRLRGLPADRYHVVVRAPGERGFTGYGGTAELLAGEVREQDVRIGRSLLTGRVTRWDTGEPLRRARVVVTVTPPAGPAVSLSAWSGAGGSYLFLGLPPGRSLLRVTPPGSELGGESRELSLPPAETATIVDFALDRRRYGRLRVRVSGPDGRPVDGVRFSVRAGEVALSTAPALRIETGLYEIELSPGVRTITARAEGLRSSGHELTVYEGRTVELTLELRPAADRAPPRKD